MKTLILYSSHDGQTKKIAEFMVQYLEGEIVVSPLTEELDLQFFDRVIIGASIRYGHFNKQLYHFVERHHELLNTKSAVFFGVNLTARKEGKDTPEGNAYVCKFLQRIKWTPAKVGVFAGALLYPRYKWIDRVMIQLIMKITGGETDTTKEIEYTVQKKETMYRICRKFNISSYELIKLNPKLKEGVKAGMTIKIPVQAEENMTTEPATTMLSERDVNALLSEPKSIERVNSVKVALLLPFMTNETIPSTETQRFIEYYEGLLLAVDSLKNTGCSIDLSVYDTGNGTKKLKEILKEDALKNANLIIGAVQNDQIGPVAEFAQKNNIKYVIPFTSKNDDVLSNAYVYQVNTPHSYLYAKAAQGGCDLFAEDNIILLNIRDGKDKTEFIKAYKAEMKQRQIPFTEINYNAETLTADVDTLLRTDKRNVIVPTSGTLEALNKIKSPLRMLAETKPECGLTLFGYPEWQTYTRDCLEDFYALNTYIYSNFYADNLSKEVADFYTKYKNWYSKNLINIFPKYGILGFDTGMFFIGAINKYGSNFENNLDKIHYQGVQTGFDFHRVNNWGGFINTNIFIVHYQSDFNVTRNEVR